MYRFLRCLRHNTRPIFATRSETIHSLFNATTMQVKDIMTKKVITVKTNTPVYEVARLIFEEHLTGMPVVDENNQVLGIITEFDLMSREKHIHIPTFLDLIKEFKIKDKGSVKDKLKEISKLEASHLMTSPVVTISPETEIKDTAKIFAEKHINPLPVVDKNNQLVGIFSRADIVKLFQVK